MEAGPAKHAHAARSRVLRQGTLVLTAYAIGLLASCAVAWAISAYYAWKSQVPTPAPAWLGVPNARTSLQAPIPLYRCDVGGVPVEFALYSTPGSQLCVAGPSTLGSKRSARPAQPVSVRPIPGWVALSMSEVVVTEATGWPALCLKYSYVPPPVLSRAQLAAASVAYSGAWSPLDRGNPRLKLPLVPIATGLAINTAFYGSLVLAGLCLLPWARRALRRHHGRCGACGYDRRGLTGEPCPECGAVPP